MPRVNHPAMCYCNHELGSPCLVSLLFIHPYMPHIFIRTIFVSFLFFLHNFARVLVQKRIRFCGKRAQHRKVIDINNINNFLFFVVVYKLVTFVLMKPCQSTSVCQVL